MSLPITYFEQLFSDNDDPWAFRRRWYEKRKRDLTLAVLLKQRYERLFEPACANGELSRALAERCESLVCMDASSTAVALAKERLVDQPHAQVLQGSLPDDWPDGTFDLIVLSEIGYYLDPIDWRRVIERSMASLTPGGSLLACHWLAPIEGCPQTGREVHEQLADAQPLHRSVRHEEADFLLELWSRQPGTFDLNEDVL